MKFKGINMIYVAALIGLIAYAGLVSILIAGMMTLPETVSLTAVSILVGYVIAVLENWHRQRSWRRHGKAGEQ